MNCRCSIHPDFIFKMKVCIIPELLPIETELTPIESYVQMLPDEECFFLELDIDCDVSKALLDQLSPYAIHEHNGFLCADGIYRSAKEKVRFLELPAMLMIRINRALDFEGTDVDCAAMEVSTTLDMTDTLYDSLFTSDCERKKYAIMGMIVGKYDPQRCYTTWHARVRIPGSDYWKLCDAKDLMYFADPNYQPERLMHQEQALDISSGEVGQMMPLLLIYMDVSTIPNLCDLLLCDRTLLDESLHMKVLCSLPLIERIKAYKRWLEKHYAANGIQTPPSNKQDVKPVRRRRGGRKVRAKRDKCAASLPLREDLECPITLMLLEDPVMLVGDNSIYSRHAITAWLRQNNISPLHGTELETQEKLTLIPMPAIASKVELYRAWYLKEGS